MRYVILGTTQALRDDGTPVPLAGGRLRALLTALALLPGRAVAADALIAEVWDGEPPADATGALQALVGRLRRALGHDAVHSADGGYRLAAGREDVDLYRFERLAEEGARALADGDPVKAAALLGDALALWRGPALADLPDRAAAAVRSEPLLLDVRRRRLTAQLALGRADHVLPELAELAAARPLDEPLRALHIRALRAAGRTVDALAAYEAVRRDLAEQLGADPSAELRALHAELLIPEPVATPPAREPVARATRSHDGTPPAPRSGAADVPPGTESGGPATRPRTRPGADARTAPAPRTIGNARARLTSFVGREAELRAVREDLTRARLVTLTGPGGTGKTRLSQEVGDRLAGRWPDGVWYAEGGPPERAAVLARRAAALLNAHDRLRSTAVAPAERRELDATAAQLRVLLGEGYDAAYAAGDGLSVDEAVALMRDVD